MSGVWLYIVIAIVMFVGGGSIATLWFGGALRKSRDELEQMEGAERDRKRRHHLAVQAEQDALEQDIVCADLDLILADHAVASDQFQTTLTKAFG